MDTQAKSPRYLGIAVAVVLLVAGVSAVAVAQPDEGDVYTGCLSESKGVLSRVAIGLEPARPCTRAQTQITWDYTAGEFVQRIAGLEAEVGELRADVEALQALLVDVTRSDDTLLFTGMNLQVVNGEGVTYSENGLGNVVIGYNEDYMNDEIRTGSHYLVVGREHTYTSHGGIVVGYDNTVTGKYASVPGGIHNTATGDHSSVTGGDTNITYGWAASVSGGLENAANGNRSSVSGGYGGSASGYISSILGGYEQTVDWDYGIYPGG